jgi:hypothetical protein
MSEVKLFSTKRMARFRVANTREWVSFPPDNIARIFESDDGEVWLFLQDDHPGFPVVGTMEDIENEVNRALNQIYSDAMGQRKDAVEKGKALVDKIFHPEKDDDEKLFELNDLVPKEVN